jgi:transcriptional regulator with XRE-family HTH domain
MSTDRLNVCTTSKFFDRVKGLNMGSPASSASAANLLQTESGSKSDVDLSHLQINVEAAESFIAEKRIGERIKYLRLKKSMGLVDLGRHTGLSASFLSQLETGRVVPTLRNLARIAMVFSKDLNYFFEPEPESLFRVHRGKQRVRMPQTGVADPSYFFESLGYLVPDRQLDPYFAEFLPYKAGREPRAHQHVGCEFLFLLSGHLDVQHGEATHRIEAGDAIYFDAETVHSYKCVGDVSATALIVTLQQQVAAQTPQRVNNGFIPSRMRNGAAQAAPSKATAAEPAMIRKNAQRRYA